MQRITDLELLNKITKGDETAFSEIFDRYKLPVFNFILRLINHPSDAEDILQEVFLAVWQGSHRFLEKSTVKTWIFRIAYHKAITSLRKNQKPYRQHFNIENYHLMSNESAPEQKMIDQWQEKEIRAAINKLSANHRSVIELAFINNFSYQEIAQIMDCPEGTVKSRMSYALRYLKSSISSGNQFQF
jgi:RNA polymerase sigma-70 factor (ECF subfamily)